MYKWTRANIEDHFNCEYHADCPICKDLKSLSEVMKLTNQEYIYIKGRSDC